MGKAIIFRVTESEREAYSEFAKNAKFPSLSAFCKRCIDDKIAAKKLEEKQLERRLEEIEMSLLLQRKTNHSLRRLIGALFAGQMLEKYFAKHPPKKNQTKEDHAAYLDQFSNRVKYFVDSSIEILKIADLAYESTDGDFLEKSWAT